VTSLVPSSQSPHLFLPVSHLTCSHLYASPPCIPLTCYQLVVGLEAAVGSTDHLHLHLRMSIYGYKMQAGASRSSTYTCSYTCQLHLHVHLHVPATSTRASLRASYTCIYTWSAEMHTDELPTSTHMTHRTDMTHVRSLCDT
jgi:hypothetical protein